MLNLRKLKQDFASNMLKEGKTLFEKKQVMNAKILHLDTKTVRIAAQVEGQFNNAYESEIEIDRLECETIDSDCDCPYCYDCQHLAAVLFYLEENLDEMLVNFSKEADLDDVAEDDEEKEHLLEVVKEAETKEEKRQDELYQKEVIEEYVFAASHLAKSPFFLQKEELSVEVADLALIYSFPEDRPGAVEIQVALRLPSRSKPLHVPQLREFIEAMRHSETLTIGGKRYYFTLDSFNAMQRPLAKMVMEHTYVPEKPTSDRGHKAGYLDLRTFGMLLAEGYAQAMEKMKGEGRGFDGGELPIMPCLFEGSFEAPLHFARAHASLKVGLEYIAPPAKKILLNPHVSVGGEDVTIEEARLFECAKPGVLVKHIYYRFPDKITRQHLRHLTDMRSVTIPEPLFGTFVENSMNELSNYAEVANQEALNEFVTLPYVGNQEAVCDLSFLNGELEAALSFRYDDKTVPASRKVMSYSDIDQFITDEGILARDLVEESKIIDDLFQDFVFSTEHEVYVAKSEKKIIEFMTDIVPRNKGRVVFNCPQNLLDQFIYDDTEFKLSLKESDRMDVYKLKMDVKGPLKGVRMDQLWDCIVSKRSYVELKVSEGKMPKILVLDLSKFAAVAQLFDELGIEKLGNHTVERPLWSIASIDASNFKGLPVKFTMSARLKEIRKQMLGENVPDFSPIPKVLKADLRGYQVEGVNWLERLRLMFLNGILADDMGLGKTLQAIVAVTQLRGAKDAPALIICPTSLLYNWKEEFHRFHGKLKTLVIDGMPKERKKLIDKVEKYDVVITSYSLLQKDVEHYASITFSYMILDEAQHIKNRGTRNAKSVKQVKAEHRLILSGTPIENSLDEMWSLFDFLMPGFLSSYDRFVEKYVRQTGDEHHNNLEYLKKKVAPFILRRMKTDVLDDLPPVSEITYRCQLNEKQKELYRSYAASARDELVKLVERDGFDKVQIHVLATLTRLKQICCHPAIFAKENPEIGDSAKYDMLLELLQTLIEGKHKTVIFSQYTRMLQIMRNELESRGIRFSYLDGSSKNRLDIVNEFNEDETIPVFLVSLKAGGTGLNLVGADTVIHYDMWWNPAVENQATDRVHRIGQKQSVSVYKLVTLGTIEEKIVEMQNRKKGIVKKIVSCDDEAITKLTWEDVLELLQT